MLKTTDRYKQQIRTPLAIHFREKKKNKDNNNKW